MSDYQRARQALGVRLRELRADACLSGRDLAMALSWSPSKVSRLELGRQTPSRDDLAAWARGVGKPDAAPELVDRLRTLESHYAAWKRQLAAGTRARQEAYAADEQRASEFLNFECAMVPGLLQTPDYARHVMTVASALVEFPSDLDEGVKERGQRQQVLYEAGHQWHFVLWEPALHTLLCPPEVMIGQLDRLAGTIGMPYISLGVLPANTRLPVIPHHGFCIYDRELVKVETAAAELRVVDGAEVRLYVRTWEHVTETAVYGAKAHKLIARAQSALPTT